MDWEGRELGERYRLERRIGKGGMGNVFAAEMTSGHLAGRKCAVKVLDVFDHSPEHRGSFRNRFLREIEIVKHLRGPHLVHVFDAGEEPDGTLWLAMDLVDQADLGAFVATEGPLEPRLAYEVAAQVADALQTAHAKGVVHRDVKPHNLFVDRLGLHPHVYIGDFGIGKIIEDELMTRSLDSPRTPSYCAPEQFDKREISAKTDVCGLGRTLFNLLTGEIPPTEGRKLPLGIVPPEAVDLLRRTTEQDPDKRPTMGEFETELRALLKKANSSTEIVERRKERLMPVAVVTGALISGGTLAVLLWPTADKESPKTTPSVLTSKPSPRPVEQSPATPVEEPPATVPVSKKKTSGRAPMSPHVAISVASWCSCSIDREHQIKVKPRVTNFSTKSIDVRTGPSSRIVLVIPAKGNLRNWKSPPETRPRYRVSGPWLLIPPNPDGVISLDEPSIPFATHWPVESLRPGESFFDAGVKQGDLVFSVPSTISKGGTITAALGYKVPGRRLYISSKGGASKWGPPASPNEF
jgi:serine/threonine protein kinase